MQNNISIGIDLGTTYCCAGFYKNKTVEIIPDENGNRIMPSYVSFLKQEEKQEEKGEILIGESAKNIYIKNSSNTIYDSKRLIGQNYSNKQIQQDMKHYSFKIKSDDQDNIMIDVNNSSYYPEEISSMLLCKIKENAENYLNQKITKAVITVPAYFNDAQRKATLRAGKLAGLEIDRIINEPTAAAIAYGLDKGNKNILIFDLGGGTLDTSILQVQDGLFEVKATSGNTHLGGEDFDNKIVEYCYSEFIKKNKFTKEQILELLTNTKYKSRLKKASEECKKILSSLLVTNVNIDSFYNGIDLEVKITRAKLEDLCNNLFKSCLIPVEEVLQSAEMSKKEIDDIVLIGGSTRIPKIKEILHNYFNKEPKTEINPDEAVAIGASIQAAVLNNTKDNILDNFLLLDVTPMTLGIETANELMTSIIPRNTAIPCEVEKVFTTYTDNQSIVNIKIYEGEKAYAKDNNLLGSFDLINLRPAKRGELKIKVKFSIDANSILSVTAIEEHSNITNNIVINKKKEGENAKIIKEQEIIEEEKIKEYLISKNKFREYLINMKNNIMTIEIKNNIGEDKFKELNNLLRNNLDMIEKLEDIEIIKETHIKIENEILNIINHKYYK